MSLYKYHILFIVAASSCLLISHRTSLSDSIKIYPEVESKFLIKHNNFIVYASNKSGSYRIRQLKGAKEYDLTSEDGFFPLLYSGSSTAFKDQNGDENFISFDKRLNEKLGNKSINVIFTFQPGDLIVFQPKGESDVYLIRGNNEPEVVVQNIKLLHHAVYCRELNSIVLNYDKTLAYLQLENSQLKIITVNEEGNKLNPFIYETDLYFSNNLDSEFYKIFKTDLKSARLKTKEVLRSEHDLRMPKFNGKALFFLEVVDNEYLLRNFNPVSATVTRFNVRGVIYNYEFYSENQIICSYSDCYTPKTLISLNIKTGKASHLIGTSIDTDLQFGFIKPTARRSPAHTITNPTLKTKGIVLFIHPGNDFSPRWDPILMNIASEGYKIFAPNYHGSYGYGKTYFSMGYMEAATDINSWKQYIKKNFLSFPIIYLTYSSGNLVMEKALDLDSNGVDAVVSLFGVPGVNTPVHSVPSLYILGKNDSRIDFESRAQTLTSERVKNMYKVLSYDNEGHFFRKTANLKSATSQVLKFIESIAY